MTLTEFMNLVQILMITFIFHIFSGRSLSTVLELLLLVLLLILDLFVKMFKEVFFSIDVPQSDANIFVLGRREGKLFHQGLKIDFMMNLDALQLRKDHQS